MVAKKLKALAVAGLAITTRSASLPTRAPWSGLALPKSHTRLQRSYARRPHSPAPESPPGGCSPEKLRPPLPVDSAVTGWVLLGGAGSRGQGILPTFEDKK